MSVEAPSVGLGVGVVHVRECERPRATRDLTLVVVLAVPRIGRNGVWTTRTIHFHALTIVSVFGCCRLGLALSQCLVALAFDLDVRICLRQDTSATDREHRTGA